MERSFRRHLLLVLSVAMLYAAGAQAEFEAGQQFGFNFAEPRGSSITRNRFYVSAKGEHAWELPSSSIVLNGFVRVIGFAGDFDNEVDFRTLSAVWNTGKFRSELGFQDLPWSETFGFAIADVVNPRDFRDALFTDPDWTRLSVCAWNTQVFLDKLTLQAVVTPVSRFNKLPVPVANPEPAAEFGGRASYLFDFGLDLGLFYYRHWNRVPWPQPLEKVHTLGFTGSQSAGDWVFRADSVVHFGMRGQPTRSQLIIGADRTESETFTWGTQYHLDRAEQTQHWLSALVRASWADRKWEAELFAFRGLDNADLWVQPKITWYFLDALAWSVRLDLVSVGSQDRLFSWVSVRF